MGNAINCFFSLNHLTFTLNEKLTLLHRLFAQTSPKECKFKYCKKMFFRISGYRETGFVYAISSAGVAHSVSRACSMGRLISCGCDPSSYTSRTTGSVGGVGKSTQVASRDGGSATQWKWGGCSHNLEFGLDFSKQFLDGREVAGDIQSTVNLHNNQAGRNVSSTDHPLTFDPYLINRFCHTFCSSCSYLPARSCCELASLEMCYTKLLLFYLLCFCFCFFSFSSSFAPLRG